VTWNVKAGIAVEDVEVRVTVTSGSPVPGVTWPAPSVIEG